MVDGVGGWRFGVVVADGEYGGLMVSGYGVS
jgi:hypothetical protein